MSWWVTAIPRSSMLTIVQQGGHFAALEQPEAFLEDVEEFVLNVVGPLS